MLGIPCLKELVIMKCKSRFIIDYPSVPLRQIRIKLKEFRIYLEHL